MKRRRLLRWALIVAALWALSGMVLIVLGVWEANAAQRQYRELEEVLSPSAVLEDRTLDLLAEIRDSLRRADRLLNNPLIAPFKLLPFFGRQLNSLSALPGSAATTASVSIDALKEARTLLQLDGSFKGQERIETVRRVSSIAKKARSRLERLDLGPSEALIPPVAKIRERLVQKIEKARKTLDSAVAVGEGLESFLTGPRRYLIAAGNNAEMRAGSGMFLSWGILETREGSLSLKGLASLPPFPAAGVAMDPDIKDRWGWAEPNREWRNLGLSPRFEPNAEMAERMWLAVTGESVDGMIAVDARALRALLEVVGPIEVDGQHIDYGSVEQIILYDQYVGVGPETGSHEARQERGARIASAAISRLNEGNWELVPLIAKLQNAVLGRHILAWSNNPHEQAAWRAGGVAGSLTSHSLLVAVNNNGANKLDQFLRVSGRMDAKPGSESTAVTLTLQLENVTPLTAPPYVLGSDPPNGKGRGVYAGILSLSLPGQATEAKVEGGTVTITGPDGESFVLGLQVVLAPGETKEVVVNFRLPGAEPSLRVESSARIPSISWQVGRSRWEDNYPREIEFD